jgi:hypothetical protein
VSIVSETTDRRSPELLSPLICLGVLPQQAERLDERHRILAVAFMVAGADLDRGTLGADVVVKGAMAGLAFSSPRLGRTTTIPLASVGAAGTNIGGETSEHIPL